MAVQEKIALEGLRSRNPAALAEVVNQHARRLYRAARGMGFSGDEAEDLAQEVFVTFLETIERFEGDLGWARGSSESFITRRRNAGGPTPATF